MFSRPLKRKEPPDPDPTPRLRDSDDTKRVATFCMSLSGLLPQDYHSLLPLMRHASQQYGDLIHRASLLLNYHFTRLCELSNGYPLFHAPMASPFLIVEWAQKLINNPQWQNQNQFDSDVLELLRGSLLQLEAELNQNRSSIIMPGVLSKVLSADLASNDIYRTNAKEHLTANFDQRIRSTFFRRFTYLFEVHRIPKGTRKELYELSLGSITQPSAPPFPLSPLLGGQIDEFVKTTRQSLFNCLYQARALVYFNADRKREDKRAKQQEGDKETEDNGDDEDIDKDYSLHDLLLRQPLAFIPFYHTLQQLQSESNRSEQERLRRNFSFYHTLRRFEAAAPNKNKKKKKIKWFIPVPQRAIFTLLPIGDRKRIHLPIDATAWSWFCNRTEPKLPKKPMAQVLLLEKIGTRLPFDPAKGSFTTDGYKASVRFGLTGRQARKDVAQTEKKRIKLGKEQAKQTKTWFAKEPCETKLEQVPPEVIRASQRLVAIDPGKRSPITAVVDSGDERFDPEITYPVISFSAGEMLHWQGRADSTRRNIELARKYKMEVKNTLLSKLSPPTSISTWTIYIKARAKNFKDCEAKKYYFHPDKARWAFQNFSARQRTFDEIANRLFGKTPKEKPPTWKKATPVFDRFKCQPTFVAFGDGSCQKGACAKGAPLVPLLGLKRHLAKRPEATFALVQESYTSQVCSLCDRFHRVTPCRFPVENKECWSVRACQGFNFGQPTTKFIDRDVNAARNILALTLARAREQKRPEQFTRDYWPGYKEHRQFGSHVFVGNSHPFGGLFGDVLRF